MKLRIFQTFVCFILICCLIFACSPIQAEAVAISGSAVAIGVGIGLAVAVGLQALGIRQGADGSAFSSLVSNCAAALSPDWAIDGLTTMLALTTDGVTRTYASRDFLQSILDWLFDSGSVLNTSPMSTEVTVCTNSDGVYDTFSCSQPIFVACILKSISSGVNAGKYECRVSVYCESQVPYYVNGGTQAFTFNSYSNTSGLYVSTWKRDIIIDSPSDLVGCVVIYGSEYGFTKEDYLSLDAPVTPLDLTLEVVGQDIDTDYETYIDESIISVDFGIQFEDDPNTGRNEEDNNKVGWVPTRLLTSSGDNYADQTQADAQSGLTDPEIVEGFKNNSGGGSDSGTPSDIFSSIKDFFTLSSDPTAWAVDLREFFPFCIPYDIYDFLSILAAEPEAPVFEWVIPVPQLGQTFELEVDLSAWDGVARLFRNLELLAFIVGLAYVTREKFIRG